MEKKRAPRNRTLELLQSDREKYKDRLLAISKNISPEELTNKTAYCDIIDICEYLPNSFVDLMIIDPPYNLNKNFNGTKFKESSIELYNEYLESWFPKILHVLKNNATVYICSDWKSSTSVHLTVSKYLTLQNRITWEREKGRGAKKNWKNNIEDIWFFTNGNDYTFNLESVKIKRQVIAPYRVAGEPKDWEDSSDGKFRWTHPSNIWTDITVPYWSMPENTDHPTQKPEKLIAKLILASSNKGDMVFDPFLGSGTTSVVSKKLDRNYFGVEINEEYAMLTEKRLELAQNNMDIQGFSGGYFWERNSLNLQMKEKLNKKY